MHHGSFKVFPESKNISGFALCYLFFFLWKFLCLFSTHGCQWCFLLIRVLKGTPLTVLEFTHSLKSLSSLLKPQMHIKRTVKGKRQATYILQSSSTFKDIFTSTFMLRKPFAVRLTCDCNTFLKVLILKNWFSFLVCSKEKSQCSELVWLKPGNYYLAASPEFKIFHY